MYISAPKLEGSVGCLCVCACVTLKKVMSGRSTTASDEFIGISGELIGYERYFFFFLKTLLKYSL